MPPKKKSAPSSSLPPKSSKPAKEPKVQKKSQAKLTDFDIKAPSKSLELGNGVFPSKNVKLASWNVNGLRAVLGRNELKKYIEKYEPDVFCLNETKIDEDVIATNSLNNGLPDGYFRYWNCCKIQKGYSGVAIFSKIKPISVKEGIGKKEHDEEGRTLTLEFEKFYLVSCYVPNAGQKLVRLAYRTNKWDPDFKNYLDDLKKSKHVILTGDLNVAHNEIDISNPKGNERSAGFTIEERTEFGKLLNDGWIDSFRNLYPKEVKYSYWSMRSNARKDNKGWRLDYFVIDEPGMKAVEDSLILNDVIGSDHCPVELKLNLDLL